MGFSWNTSCFSLRTAHEFRRGNKIMLLVCGGDMDVLTPPTPSDSLCQALDLYQVQRARFQNGAPFCGTINSFSTLVAPTKTRKPRSSYQTSRWVCPVFVFTLPTACKEHSQSFTLACLFFQLVIPSTAVCQCFKTIPDLNAYERTCHKTLVSSDSWWHVEDDD